MRGQKPLGGRDRGPGAGCHGLVFLQFRQDHRAQLRHAAGAQGQNHVSRVGDGYNSGDPIAKRGSILRCRLPGFANQPDQGMRKALRLQNTIFGTGRESAQ